MKGMQEANFFRNLKERNRSKNLDLCKIIILKWILKTVWNDGG
jgi:hypothetical protein